MFRAGPDRATAAPLPSGAARRRRLFGIPPDHLALSSQRPAGPARPTAHPTAMGSDLDEEALVVAGVAGGDRDTPAASLPRAAGWRDAAPRQPARPHPTRRAAHQCTACRLPTAAVTGTGEVRQPSQRLHDAFRPVMQAPFRWPPRARGGKSPHQSAQLSCAAHFLRGQSRPDRAGCARWKPLLRCACDVPAPHMRILSRTGAVRGSAAGEPALARAPRARSNAIHVSTARTRSDSPRAFAKCTLLDVTSGEFLRADIPLESSATLCSL